MPSQFCRHVSTWIVIMALKLTDFSLFQKGHKQSKSEYQLNDQVSAWYQSTQSAFYIFEWRSATGFLITGWGVWADKIPLEKIIFHWFSLLLFPKAISTTNRPPVFVFQGHASSLTIIVKKTEILGHTRACYHIPSLEHCTWNQSKSNS